MNDLVEKEGLLILSAPRGHEHLMKYEEKHRTGKVDRFVKIGPGNSLDHVVIFLDFGINKEAGTEEVCRIESIKETVEDTLVIARSDLHLWGFSSRCVSCKRMTPHREMLRMCSKMHRLCRTHLIDYWQRDHPDVTSAGIRKHLEETHKYTTSYEVRDDALWEFRGLICFGSMVRARVTVDSPEYAKVMTKNMNLNFVECMACAQTNGTSSAAIRPTRGTTNGRDLMSLYRQIYGGVYRQEYSLYPPLPALVLEKLSPEECRAIKQGMHGQAYEFIWQIQNDVDALKKMAKNGAALTYEEHARAGSHERVEYRQLARQAREEHTISREADAKVGSAEGTRPHWKAGLEMRPDMTSKSNSTLRTAKGAQAKALYHHNLQASGSRMGEAEKVRILEQYRIQRERGLSEKERERFVERLDRGRRLVKEEPRVDVSRSRYRDTSSAYKGTERLTSSLLSSKITVTAYCPKKGFMNTIAKQHQARVRVTLAKDADWSAVYRALCDAITETLGVNAVDREQAMLWLCETEQGGAVADYPLNERDPPQILDEGASAADWLEAQFESGHTGVFVSFVTDSIMMPQTLANNPFVNKEDGELLRPKYEQWRVIRGDGNCYYRSVYFAVLEFIVNSGRRDLLARMADRFSKLRRVMFRDGMEWNDHQKLIEVLKKETEGQQWLTSRGLEAQLLGDFEGVLLDLALIRACRVLTAQYLMENVDGPIDPFDETNKTTWKEFAMLDYCDEPGAEEKNFTMQGFCDKFVLAEGAYVTDVVCNTGLLPRLLGDLRCHTWVLDHGGNPIREEVSNPTGKAGSIHLLFLHTRSAAARHYEILCPLDNV